MAGQSTVGAGKSTPSRLASRASTIRSAGSTYIFVGMQPTLRQVPPKRPCSTIPMSSPSSSGVTRLLPDPVPMMSRSWCGIGVHLLGGQPGGDDLGEEDEVEARAGAEVVTGDEEVEGLGHSVRLPHPPDEPRVGADDV